MVLFNASEIYQFAIKIEENGEKFYKDLARKIENEEIKNLFNYLASEEVKHKETFENMLSKIKDYDLSGEYPEEYFTYLRTYANNIVFSEERLNEEIEKIKDIVSALDFGIQKEVETILYYQEIKNLIPKDQHSLIDAIIEEERGHFLKLSQIKENLLKEGRK